MIYLVSDDHYECDIMLLLKFNVWYTRCNFLVNDSLKLTSEIH